MKKNNFTEKVFIINSSKATRGLGRDFAKVLEKGDIVCLYGDLGSGKTTFVQGLARGLGVKQRIISPTFIIVRCYELQTQKSSIRQAQDKIQNYLSALSSRPKGNSKLKSLERFYHIDLYRIGNEKDLNSLGIEEIINNKNNIVVIEWAQNLKSSMPKKRIDIKFSYEKEGARKAAFSLTT